MLRACDYHVALQTAVRRIQTAIESGEWTTFCAASSSVNPKFVSEKTTAPTRSTANLSHKAPSQQASISAEYKAPRGLGAGLAAAAELEDTRVSPMPASLPRPRFSPSSGNQSPSSVSFCSHVQLIATKL